MHLALGDNRVDDAARVVDSDEAPELDGAGLGVHLDDGDVRAEGEGGRTGLEDLLGAQLVEPAFCRRAGGQVAAR